MKTKNLFTNTCAVVLAAGKGKRMNAKSKNKVVYELSGEPIIVRIVNNLRRSSIPHLVIVVGYARESVQKLVGNSVLYAYQRKRLGTGHALKVGLKVVPKICSNIFVFYGDDTSYSPEILRSLLEKHITTGADITFLTLSLDDPTGLGRICRSTDGSLIGIVEEKDATPDQKKIREINPGCFVFSRNFLDKYINKIPKSLATGEYYLTNLIELALHNSLNVQTYMAENLIWRGINTPTELQEAEMLLGNS